MKFFGRRDQPAVAGDRSKLIKDARFHKIHSPECQNQLAPSVNEVQPTRDELREDIGIHHDDDADDGCERHGMPENKTEDGAFVADQGYSEPADESAKEWKKPAGARESEA